MIHLRETLETARDILSENNIGFALIGGFALSAYGIHRATKDIDILVDGNFKKKVKELFIGRGFSVFFESEEVLQLNGPGYLDIIFANRPLSLEMIYKAKGLATVVGVSVVSKEALIGLKIQAYKNDSNRELQDKADIQALLREGEVNLDLVKKFADLFNAWNEVQELMK